MGSEEAAARLRRVSTSHPPTHLPIQYNSSFNPPSSSLPTHPPTYRQATALYESGVEGLNDYVARHKRLVEVHGVQLLPMSGVSLGQPLSVPCIEELGEEEE